MKTLINYVATGSKARELFRLSVKSLYLTGYTGDVRLYTDVKLPRLDFCPNFTQVLVPAGSIYDAKKLKVASLLEMDGYDRAAILDVDTLMAGKITNLMRGTDVLATSTSRKIRSSMLKNLPDLIAGYEDRPLIDTYFIVVSPGHADFVKSWYANTLTIEKEIGFGSDCHAFNKTLIERGVYGDVKIIPEAERLHGPPKPGTIIQHYVHGQSWRMPLVFENEILSTYRRSLHAAGTT